MQRVWLLMVYKYGHLVHHCGYPYTAWGLVWAVYRAILGRLWFGKGTKVTIKYWVDCY